MAITLQQLKIFLAVSVVQNTSEVARGLKLRQSTVNFHIKSLEDSLGLALFTRVRQRWQLTAAGDLLLSYAKSLTATATEAERVMRDFHKSQYRRLSVGASETPSACLVPAMLQRFHALHPDIKLDLQALSNAEICRQVETKQVDIGFMAGPVPDDVALTTMLLSVLEIGYVVNPEQGKHLRATSLIREEFRDLPLIGYKQGSVLETICEAWANHNLDVSPDPLIIVESTKVMVDLVKLGIGAALIMKVAVTDEVARGELLYLPVVNPPTLALHAILHEGYDKPLLQDLITVAREVLPQP